MTKKILSIFICTAIILSSFAFVGCDNDKQLKIIRLCEVTHSIFYAPQYVAIALGFFEDEGLEIELTNGGGADKVMSAVISNSVDIGLAGPEASIYVYNEGRDDYTEVFGQLTACDGSFLVARYEDNSFSWEKLTGAHILPGRKGGMPYMAFRYAIENAGLDPDRDMVLDNTIQFDMMTGAFLSGTGDYVTMFEPVASSVQAEGKGYIVASVGEAAGPMPYTTYFAKKSYVAENSDIIQRFTNAIAMAQKWVGEHSAREIAEAVADFFADTDITLLESAIENYKKIGAYSSTPIMSKEDFDRLQEVMIAAGELDGYAPFEKIINNTFANNALSK